MRKLFTTIVMAALALTASATDYNDNMRVTLDGTTIFKGATTISVDVEDAAKGTYVLNLKNFVLSADAAVGNIHVTNVPSTTYSDGTVTLATEQEITIEPGDLEGVKNWLGPMLQEVPVKVYGRIKGGKLYANIVIDNSLGYITVDFGENGYQIGNSDFELFHEAKYKEATSDEPDFWHSFMSSTGELANMVSGASHTFINDADDDAANVRPGSTGSKSLKLISTVVEMGVAPLTIKIPANGTVTTGRLQAGSATASNASNCSFMDLSKTDVDAIGDPFEARLNGQPDAMKVWVKFKQGPLAKKNKAYVYATVNAVITDGTYYQDPEGKNNFKNVVAKATNNMIESKDFAWQELTVPFDYDTYAANNAKTKAILVTFSTNAQPGVGSTNSQKPDELWIDDMSLVYYSQLSAMTVKGNAVAAFNKDTYEYNIDVDGAITADDIKVAATGRQALVDKKVEKTAEGYKATVSVTAADYSETHVYTLNIKNVASGIDNVENTANAAPAAIYNAAGQRVSNMTKGLNIVKMDNGNVKKVLKK